MLLLSLAVSGQCSLPLNFVCDGWEPLSTVSYQAKAALVHIALAEMNNVPL